MARWIPGTGSRTFVCTQAGAIDLGNAAGDVDLEMVCPADDAHLVKISFTIHTAGGEAENHNLVVEHGAGAAGAALSGQIDVLSNAAAGTIVTADALGYAAQPATVEGTTIQVSNAEEGAISNGAILNVSLIWEL